MIFALQLAILLIFLLLWQFYAISVQGAAFYVSSPTRIVETFGALVMDGSLPRDMAVTAFEALSGLILGTAFGTLLGAAFWFSPLLSRVAYPYIIGLGSIPIFALSPLVIIWIGVGLTSKVVLAALASFFTALYYAYQGANDIDRRLMDVLDVFGATRAEAFRKAVVPKALTSVMNGARANIGFSLAGAFIGEVISSEVGLGHLVIVAMGLFDMSRVMVGAISFALIALTATICLDRYSKQLVHKLISYL